ncbi:MAG: type IV secretory system conjugative DNA transfer family protein [Alphaproteobacteria bacterium]
MLNIKSRIKQKHLNPHIAQAHLWAIAMLAGVAVSIAAGVYLSYPAALVLAHGVHGPSLDAAASSLAQLVRDPNVLWLTLRDGVLTAVEAVRQGTPWPYAALPVCLALVPLGLASTTLYGLVLASGGELSFRETHLGSAEWADDRLLAKRGMFDGFGLVLGRFGHPLKGKLLRMPGETLSIMTISPPGTGKTVNLIGNILADHPDSAPIPCPSLIINDPKGEIYAKTAGWRSTRGPVYHLRWTDLEGTCFNPLSIGNVPTGTEIVPRRKALIEKLGQIYEDPMRAVNGLMVAARDFGDAWRAMAVRDPALGFTMATVSKGSDGLALLSDPQEAARRLKSMRIFEEVGALAAVQTKIDSYVNRLAAVAVPMSGGENSHFEVNGRAALSGFLLYSIYDAIDRRILYDDPREASFGSMLTWLAGVGIDPDKSQEEMEQEMEADEQSDDAVGQLLEKAIAQARNRGYPARVAEELSQLKIKPGRERGSVLSTAVGKLNIFKSDTIRARTSRSDFTFSDLRGVLDENGIRRPVTVYFDVPLEDSEAVGIPTGFFIEGAAAFLISQEEKEAKTRPVVFALDEFWTLPKMDSIQQIPALGRGQWVQLNIIGQSRAQIALKLGKDALQILADAIAVKLYYTLNDHTAAEEVSKSIGSRTIEQENNSNTSGLFPSFKSLELNKQRSFSAQPLMRPDELMSMPKLQPAKKIWGEVVIQVTGMMNRPIKAAPVVYWEDPVLRKRQNYELPDFVAGPKGVRMKQWRTLNADVAAEGIEAPINHNVPNHNSSNHYTRTDDAQAA